MAAAVDNYTNDEYAVNGQIRHSLEILHGGSPDPTYQRSASDTVDIDFVSRRVVNTGTSNIVATIDIRKRGGTTQTFVAYEFLPGLTSIRISRVYDTGITLPAGCRLFVEE